MHCWLVQLRARPRSLFTADCAATAASSSVVGRLSASGRVPTESRSGDESKRQQRRNETAIEHTRPRAQVSSNGAVDGSAG